MKDQILPFIIIVLIAIAWMVFGDPPKTAANLFWQDRPAPWEEVDGYFYPDRDDLAAHTEETDLPSLEACREWAYFSASLNGDPQMARGDYECAVGRQDNDFGLNVYRITVR